MGYWLILKATYHMTNKIDQNMRDFISVEDSKIRTKIKKSVYARIKDDAMEMISYSLDEEVVFIWSEINDINAYQIHLNQKNGKRNK